MISQDHDFCRASYEMYAKLKLLRIMDDKIAELIKRRGELHKEVIKIFEKNFKIKGESA